HTPIGLLQALPSNGVPVINWSSQDDAFADTARGIRSVLQSGELPPSVIPPPTFPLVCNIPYPRNPVFTGQEEILKQIKSQLQSGQATAHTQPQAITGLGGIGKTQIAVEYAWNHQSDYQNVLWSRADTY